MSYSKLSLRLQVALPTLLLLILIAVQGYLAVSGLEHISDRSMKMGEKLRPATGAILNADRDLYQAAVALRDYVTLRTKQQPVADAKKDFDDNVRQATDRMMKARTLAGDAGIRLNPESEFRAAMGLWLQEAAKVMSAADAGNGEAAHQLMNSSEGKAFSALRDRYDRLGESVDEASTALGGEIAAVHARELGAVTSIVIITLIVAVLATLFVPRLIAAPLLNLEKMMGNLADGGGDLTQRLPAEGDNETARLAKQVNRLLAFLQTMIAEAQDHIREMDQAVRGLMSSASQTGERAQHQSQSVDQVLTAVHQMQQAIQEIASRAQNTSGESERANQDVKVSSRAINDSASQVHVLAKDMDVSVNLITALEAESKNIASVVDVIGGIAEQTNLLALNAAIEAARAGEAGRGFAVVADEVRTLASRTQQSTQDIQQMIERLEQGVAGSVKAMQGASTQVDATVEGARVASEALDNIVQGINAIDSMSTEIATATEEQSVVANHINDTVNEINHQSDQLTALADSTRQASEALERSVRAVSGHMGRFKV